MNLQYETSVGDFNTSGCFTITWKYEAKSSIGDFSRRLQ